MATTEEIARRVQQADIARSAQRAAAAQRVGELAGRRATLAEQLDEIERALGDELSAAQKVMDVDELAAFTDVPAADLTRWLSARTARKPARAHRKRAAEAADVKRATSSRRSTANMPASTQTPAVPEAPGPRTGASGLPPHVPVEVA